MNHRNRSVAFDFQLTSRKLLLIVIEPLKLLLLRASLKQKRTRRVPVASRNKCRWCAETPTRRAAATTRPTVPPPSAASTPHSVNPPHHPPAPPPRRPCPSRQRCPRPVRLPRPLPSWPSLSRRTWSRDAYRSSPPPRRSWTPAPAVRRSRTRCSLPPRCAGATRSRARASCSGRPLYRSQAAPSLTLTIRVIDSFSMCTY